MSEGQQAPRHEREECRVGTLARSGDDLPQEIRVLPTGSPILAAVLVAPPFPARFPERDAVPTALDLDLLLSLLLLAVLPVGLQIALPRGLAPRQEG